MSTGTHTGSIRRRLLRAAMLLVVASAALAAGCGGSEEAAYTPVAGTESAYCDTLRAWQVHELDGGEGDDQPTAAALRAYHDDYLEFNATMLRQAPAEVRDEWVVSERAVRTVLTPVLEKYGFDMKRLVREGTPAEKALSTAPPDVQRAQAAIHAYEARVCGLSGPPAAKVVFKRGASSAAYCKALGAYDDELGKIESSKFTPDVMRRFLTSDRFTKQLEAMDETAPAELTADVRAENEWFRTRWRDVIEEFGYDIRRIWTESSPEDRAVLTLSHPEVAKHAARTTAYEEQVCGL
jgi:hypothetical protein